MAAPITGLSQTFDAVGMREDLENIIYDISPTETPMLSMAARMSAKNVKHEWQTDALTAATKDNTVIQGNTVTADTRTTPKRLANMCQLMDKAAVVSSTQQAVDMAGRADEMAYQMAKRSLELKRDLDCAITQNNAACDGSADSAVQLAGLETWLCYASTHDTNVTTANGTSVQPGATTRTTYGPDSTLGYPSVVCANGTTIGTLTETIFKNVLARCVTNGANITTIMTSPRLKQKLAKAFAGIATRYREVRGDRQASIIAGADLYVSDFGDMVLRYSRQCRDEVTTGCDAQQGPIFGLDPEQLGVAYLQPFHSFDLAKTGHNVGKAIAVEATLVVKNPLGLFKIGDVGYITA